MPSFISDLLSGLTSNVPLIGPNAVGSSINSALGTGGMAPSRSGYGSMMLGPDGKLYRRAGRPLLWSGDVSAMKRLRKVNKMMHQLFPVHHARARRRLR